MTEMKNARWAKMVKRVAQPGEDCHYLGLYLSAGTATRLLARQHAAVVRLVKRRKKQYEQDASDVDLVLACEEILADLAKQGGKK